MTFWARAIIKYPRTEREPTAQEQILASLLAHGPAAQADLVTRLQHVNANTVRRELAELLARDEIEVLGHRRPGSVGRAAYIYTHPEYEITRAEREAATPSSSIRPSSPEEDDVEPRLFSRPGEPLPAIALRWDPEYQLVWRNGLPRTRNRPAHLSVSV